MEEDILKNKMAGRFKRSWEIAKITFSIIKEDKKLLWFPILSSIFSMALIIFLLVPKIMLLFSSGEGLVWTSLEWVLIFITYFGVAFIAVFFNFCISYAAAMHFNKNKISFSKIIGFSLSKIHKIFLWSLVTATVGLILKLAENFAEKMKGAGKIILLATRLILGLAWAISTIFVIPTMVYQNLGPFGSIKKSVSVLKKTWGEYLIKSVGFGVVAIIFMIPVFIIALLLMVVGISLPLMAILILILIFIAYTFIISTIVTTMSMIYDTALYAYAESGVVPTPYTEDMMANAFRNKKNKSIQGPLKI